MRGCQRRLLAPREWSGPSNVVPLAPRGWCGRKWAHRSYTLRTHSKVGSIKNVPVKDVYLRAPSSCAPTQLKYGGLRCFLCRLVAAAHGVECAFLPVGEMMLLHNSLHLVKSHAKICLGNLFPAEVTLPWSMSFSINDCGTL
jgi:hypothetical protein